MNIKENVGENIKAIRKAKDISQEKLEELTGIARTNISAYENGKSRPSLETLKKFAKGLEVSLGYLLGESAYEFGKQFYEKNVENRTQKSKNDDTLIQIPLSKVPLIVGSVTAGAFNVDISSWDGEWVYVDHATKNMLEWKIKGRSMEPDYLDGDIVIIDKSMPWKDGNDVIARRNGDEVTIKRVTVLPENRIELRPLNPKYPTLMFTEGEEIELVGVVVKLVRDQLKKKK